jgi:hypothetical protein
MDRSTTPAIVRARTPTARRGPDSMLSTRLSGGSGELHARAFMACVACVGFLGMWIVPPPWPSFVRTPPPPGSIEEACFRLGYQAVAANSTRARLWRVLRVLVMACVACVGSSARPRPRRNRRRCGASPSAPWTRPSNARLNSDRSPASPPETGRARRRRFPPAAEPPSAGGPESRAGSRAVLALRPRSGGCASVSGRAGGRSPRASSARRRGRSGARAPAVRAR